MMLGDHTYSYNNNPNDPNAVYGLSVTQNPVCVTGGWQAAIEAAVSGTIYVDTTGMS